MSNENAKLFASTELTGAVASKDLSIEQEQALMRDPHSFINQTLNLDVSSLDISVVANSASDVHIALPYYEGLAELQASIIADDKMEDAAGGEILITLFALIGAGITTGFIAAGTGAAVAGGVVGGVVGAVAATGIAVGTATAIQNRDGKNLDGSKIGSKKGK